MTNRPIRTGWQRNSLIVTTAAALVFTGAFASPLAFATPAEDQLTKAKAQEQQVSNQVNDLEKKLGEVRKKQRQAEEKSQVAADAYNDAMSNLVIAQENVKKTAAQAAEANTKVAEAKKELAAVARSAYTSQGSLSALTPYLENDGLASVEMRRVAVQLFGNKADQQLHTFNSIKKVAEVINAAAEQAKKEKAAAAASVKQTKQEADNAATKTAAERSALQGQYAKLVDDLAQARGVTLEAEQARQAEIEKAQKEAEEKAAADALAAATKAAQADADARAKALAEAKAKADAEAKAKAEAEAKNKDDADKKDKADGNDKKADKQKKSDKSDDDSPVPTGSATGAAVIEYAKQFLGVPYVWAANGPDAFDCSGFTRYVFRHFGINLPRQSRDQRNVGHEVSAEEAQAGDLVSYVGHVAIYIGNGYMIHAPKPGDHVKIAKVYGNPIYKRIL